MSGESLDVDTVTHDLALTLEAVEVGHNVLRESVLTGDEDGLTAWELEARSAEGLFSSLDEFGSGSDGNQRVTDFDTACLGVGLAVSLSHTLLESIGTGAREHLVDADGVPRVRADAHVECFSTCLGLHVLVGSNTGSFEGLRRNLLLLVGNENDAARELGEVSLLVTTIEETDLRVRHTTVEARLGIRLVLLVSIAASGSSSHLFF